MGKIWLFLIVDLTLHGQWHICQVRCQPQCSGSFACLGSQSSLVNRTNKPVEVVKARCHSCSSMLCLSANEPKSLQQRQLCKNQNFGPDTVLRKNHNFGTIASQQGLK